MEQKQGFSVRGLLTGPINSLRYVTRYSTSLVIHRENVAEHSYYVSLYAMMIHMWYVDKQVQTAAAEGRSLTAQECETNTVERISLLQKALLHDGEEALTGDAPRPYKHSDKELLKHMERVASIMARRVFEGISAEKVDMLVGIWETSKDNDVPGMVVSFADYLSVLSHLYAEVKSANYTVMRNYETLTEYRNTYRERRFDFLRPLIDESEEIFEEMLVASGYHNLLESKEN